MGRVISKYEVDFAEIVIERLLCYRFECETV